MRVWGMYHSPSGKKLLQSTMVLQQFFIILDYSLTLPMETPSTM